MSFAQLIFLFGGLAVVGPLIAHLLAKPRFRRLPFTMLRFLRTGQTESQSRRRLRDLLMLLLRCAIIVLIAMLFAQPRLLTEPETEETRPVYYLGLDNSMSMAYSDGSRSYFNELVDSAVDYIRSADDAGLFNICALASGDWASGLSKEAALAEVKGLKIVPNTADISGFLSVVGSTRSKEYEEGEVSVLVVSDFTPNTLEQFFDITEPAAVDNTDYKLIVSPKPINNAAVIDAHAKGFSDGKLIINATVINYGQAEQSRQLAAKIGENKLASADVELSANQRTTYPVKIDIDVSGAEQLYLPVELSLSAGDGVRADDTFYLAVSVPEHETVNVLLADSGRREMFLLKTAINALSRRDSYNIVSIKQVLCGDITLSDLEWADVIICSAMRDARLGYIAPDLKNFVKAGGKIIFFMTDDPSRQVVEQLWGQDVLPALPGRCIREAAYIQPRACDNHPLGMDKFAAKSLSNYRIDKIVLTGYLECEQHTESICVWRLQNGSGFVFLKPLGNGVAILVNTSVDDSLGSLTKSNASIAFCQYLLGQSNRISEHSFACGERVMLPASDMEVRSTRQKQFWVETCDGRKREVDLVESLLLVPNPAGIGWVKTLNKPTRYAGINLPDGETDMTKPTVQEVASVMGRVFRPQIGQDTATAEIFGDKEYKPIWNIFAWLIIALLLAEATIANRLKR